MLLGLIPKSTWRDLHLIRRIRNDFAHSSAAITFSHEPIAARCRELTHAPMADPARPRARYLQGVMGAAGFVDAAIERIGAGSMSARVEASDTSPNASQLGTYYEAFVGRLADLLEASGDDSAANKVFEQTPRSVMYCPQSAGRGSTPRRKSYSLGVGCLQQR